MTDPIRGARLAERLAALSLGIDLGFGQPMKHVLRQCRIALRMCELAGAGDDTRAAAYYSALLVNVGCHTDAYEQAQWFGDDIALKALKYARAASKLSEMAVRKPRPSTGPKPAFQASARKPVTNSHGGSRLSNPRN